MPRKLNDPLRDHAWVEALVNSTRNTDILGDLCKFDISGVEIAPDELKRLLEQHGLVDWMPVPIKASKAVRKAITRIRPSLEEAENQKVLVRPVLTDDEEETRYTIMDEYHDSENHTIRFSERTQVVYDGVSRNLTFTKEESPEIRDQFNYLCSVYTDAEVSLMTKNIIKKHGAIPLRDNSGMFFMSGAVRSVTDSLGELFNSDLRNYLIKNGTCYFRPIGIANTEQNCTVMREALLSELDRALDAAEDYLDEALTSPKQRRTMAVSGALDQFESIGGRLILYEQSLGLYDTTSANTTDSYWARIKDSRILAEAFMKKELAK